MGASASQCDECQLGGAALQDMPPEVLQMTRNHLDVESAVHMRSSGRFGANMFRRPTNQEVEDWIIALIRSDPMLSDEIQRAEERDEWGTWDSPSEILWQVSELLKRRMTPIIEAGGTPSWPPAYFSGYPLQTRQMNDIVRSGKRFYQGLRRFHPALADKFRDFMREEQFFSTYHEDTLISSWEWVMRNITGDPSIRSAQRDS